MRRNKQERPASSAALTEPGPDPSAPRTGGAEGPANKGQRHRPPPPAAGRCELPDGERPAPDHGGSSSAQWRARAPEFGTSRAANWAVRSAPAQHLAATAALLLCAPLLLRAQIPSAGAGQRAGSARHSAEFPGKISLPVGFAIRPAQGVDSAVGRIVGPMTIEYDIGAMAGVATQSAGVRTGARWIIVGASKADSPIELVMTSRGELVVSYPGLDANFRAMPRSSRDLATALLIILSYEPAQPPIEGKIMDISGAPLPGAAVVLLYKNGGRVASLETGPDGLYEFRIPRPSGPFRICVSLRGFYDECRSGLGKNGPPSLGMPVGGNFVLAINPQ